MLYGKNDVVHQLLSKARPPSQQTVDDPPGRRRPKQYGDRRVLEVDVGEALTDFSMGGRATGVAWSLNPYTGCMHSCGFCYVPETMHVERRNWGTYIIAKRNLPTKLAREMAQKPRKTVYLSTGTDPYQAAEADHGITRACLRQLLRKDWPVEIITRGPLVVRDADLLARFTRAQVGLSVPTLDDAARRLLEPAAPPIPARLDALRKLSGQGLRVYANYTPVYPPTNGFMLRDVARTFKEAGVLWVNASAWSRQAGYLARLWDRTHGTEWEDLTRFIGDPERQERVRQELRAELDRVGIPMRGGFFNRPYVAPEATQATTLEEVGALARPDAFAAAAGNVSPTTGLWQPGG